MNNQPTDQNAPLKARINLGQEQPQSISVAPFEQNAEAPPLEEANHTLMPDGRIVLKEEYYELGNGQIFYDAMSSVIYAANSQANYGVSTDQAGSLEDEYWGASVSADGDGNNNLERRVKRIRYYHRYGYNKLIVSGQAKAEHTTSGGLWNRSWEWRAKVVPNEGGTTQASDSETITASGSYYAESMELDVSGLTPNTFYLLELYLSVSVDGDATNTLSDSTEATVYMREDILVTTST